MGFHFLKLKQAKEQDTGEEIAGSVYDELFGPAIFLTHTWMLPLLDFISSAMGIVGAIDVAGCWDAGFYVLNIVTIVWCSCSIFFFFTDHPEDDATKSINEKIFAALVLIPTIIWASFVGELAAGRLTANGVKMIFYVLNIAGFIPLKLCAYASQGSKLAEQAMSVS
eukprot:CAMPEP_0182562096 /NCGR_PEP_ID=MMETSP1324-20130603/4479_1 /TAXON_ID=236786 /ORGANISM="Florenciella sp., Strain RCC1587" /LENGTH=166 /DNA_ID=CAMNT_0024774921 /DNA_START=1 /DNA_END=501 /DNA_ORIENTATION=-